MEYLLEEYFEDTMNVSPLASIMGISRKNILSFNNLNSYDG